MCGEQDIPCKGGNNDRGSPPRVRGTDSEWSENAAIVGITPACAGNSNSRNALHTAWEDHPRVCGEQVFYRLLVTADDGSPPRVRGTDVVPSNPESGDGITPACAGNSQPRAIEAAVGRDHPRVCGEQFSHDHGMDIWMGSPPRVRGTDYAKTTISCRGRITPACAGNRDYQTPLKSGVEDHPRVCGEQLLSPMRQQV